MKRAEIEPCANSIALLHSHRTAVFHFLYRMLQDGAVAEKLAAEVFLKLNRAGARAGATAQAPTFLFRMAADLALREPLRQSPARPATERSAGRLDVHQAVAIMPAQQRAAVLMHKYHRMNYRQIATVLNCSESAARSLLLSAYENLRRWLTPPTAHETCTANGSGPRIA